MVSVHVLVSIPNPCPPCYYYIPTVEKPLWLCNSSHSEDGVWSRDYIDANHILDLSQLLCLAASTVTVGLTQRRL